MSFKITQFEVKPGSASPGGQEGSHEMRIMKLNESNTPTVTKFEFGQIKALGEGNYAAAKQKYGALAGTDKDRKAKDRKDERFQMNPILRDRLSIEAEEKRAIEERVQATIRELQVKAQEEAAQLGFEEGFAKGREEAFAQFKQEGEERISRLETLIRDLDGARIEIYNTNERYLVDLIYRMGRMIILKDLEHDKEYLLRLCKHLIERTGVKENIRLRIHPEDLVSTEQIREGLQKSFGNLNNLQIEASSQVELGSCIVETDWNAINANIETQLAGIYEALVGKKPDEGTEVKS